LVQLQAEGLGGGAQGYIRGWGLGCMVGGVGCVLGVITIVSYFISILYSLCKAEPPEVTTSPFLLFLFHLHTHLTTDLHLPLILPFQKSLMLNHNLLINLNNKLQHPYIIPIPPVVFCTAKFLLQHTKKQVTPLQQTIILFHLQFFRHLRLKLLPGDVRIQ
jgi:hypothetical protein